MSTSRNDRRELARDLAKVVQAMPEEMLPALDVLIGATREGRAGVILIVGGPEVRISLVVAGSERVADTVEAFDSAYAHVPGHHLNGGADAKSTH